MEEQKLVKRKKKAQISGNRRGLAESCNDLASYYFKLSRYDDALDEYREEADIYKDLGLRMEWGTSNRMIAETYMMMAEFDRAVKYEEKHLVVARELNNQVEEQRALATLGRIRLLQGQSVDAEEAEMCLRAAEKAFMKSLVLCEGLKGQINMREIMDMRARLLLNIGVVLEHLGIIDKAVTFMRKAVTICANQDLYEILHQCYITEAHLHTSKTKDYSRALQCLNKALEVASRLEDKVLKQCETLALKAVILCKMSDYQSAKQVLLKAWKLDTPSNEEKENIEKNLKIVAALCYTEDLLLTADATDHKTLKKLHEKLGDGACALNNYSAAVESYLQMLNQAELAGEHGKALIPTYVSLYQTYKDMGMYYEALEYYNKEYELIRDEPKEAYVTLCNIAETSYLAKKPYEEIEKACDEARIMAAQLGQRYKIRLLKRMLQYQEKYGETDKMDDTKAELKLLGVFDLENFDTSEDESGPSQDEDTPNIGDDICIEDLTDLSDSEEGAAEQKKETRKRGRGFTIKKNAKGETQLHVACISGNKLLVERLLSAGHPVNVRDNAGWMPLHEACINGHLDIAELLVDRGAHINDRGGADCDGITPIYDAACNGYIEIIQMLIRKGAVLSLKTDFGETALAALQKWRKKNILNKEQEMLYKHVCNQITNYLDKRPMEESAKSPVKMVSSPSKSKNNKNRDNSPVSKRRNLLDDDDLFDEADTNKFDDTDNSDSREKQHSPKKNEGVSEYRNAIFALRNRSITEVEESEVETKTLRPALLDTDEIDDDWLDDDLGGNKNKKRKICDDAVVTAAKKPIDSIREPVSCLTKSNPSVSNTLSKSNSDRSSSHSRSRISDVIDSDESSDSDNFRCENINPRPNSLHELLKGKILDSDSTRSQDTRTNMKKRWKRQSTLLKAGFQRKRRSTDRDDFEYCSSNSNSDCEITSLRTREEVSLTSFCRKPSNERLDKSRRTESTKASVCLPRKSLTESPRKNCIPQLSNLSRKPSKELLLSAVPSLNSVQPRMRTQAGVIIPPAAVRVKVEDKVLLISLNSKTINKLSISWLVEEIKNRYYKLSGVRPVFSLMTSDGAILSEEDPLSLVLTSPELQTCITNWKATPAEERYQECCAALEIETSQEIQQAIGRSHNTHRLALGARTLSTNQVRPLFRAIVHQTHLTALMLSDNNLRDDGMKSLAACLPTLRQLTLLDLSMNGITCAGARCLLSVVSKTSSPGCVSLEHLNFSFNPIADDGFRIILETTTFLNVKTLKLNNCAISEHALNCTKPQMNLDKIEVIDLSNNQIKQALLEEVLLELVPWTVTELDLENVGVNGNEVSVFLGKFFENVNESRIRIKRLNLSRCSLTDGDFMKIYRYLMRSRNLQSMILKNNALTFISLKKLLRQSPPVPQISVEGCADVFKYSLDSDFPIWLPAIDFGRCIPEINVTAPVEESHREGFKVFSKIWLSCFKGRGVIEHVDGGVVRFTAR